MFNKIGTYAVDELKTAYSTPKNRLKSLFSRKAKSISNTSITLHPKGVGEGYETYKTFSIEQGIKSGSYLKIGYISDFKGMKEEAISIHGTPINNIIMNVKV